MRSLGGGGGGGGGCCCCCCCGCGCCCCCCCLGGDHAAIGLGEARGATGGSAMAVAIFVGGDLVRWRELAVPPRREGGLIRKGRDSSGSGSGRYRSGSSCLVA